MVSLLIVLKKFLTLFGVSIVVFLIIFAGWEDSSSTTQATTQAGKKIVRIPAALL